MPWPTGCGPAAPGGCCPMTCRPGRPSTTTSAAGDSSDCGSRSTPPSASRSGSGRAAGQRPAQRSWTARASRPPNGGLHGYDGGGAGCHAPDRVGVRHGAWPVGGGADLCLAGTIPPPQQGLRIPDRHLGGSHLPGHDPAAAPPRPAMSLPEFVIVMGRWLAGGSGRCGRGSAVGAATATRRRYGLVPGAGSLVGRSKLRKASGVRKAVISWICGPRRVSTSMARGTKACAVSSQA
jgi:hypothetical protein